jgi:hypothetical protein
MNHREIRWKGRHLIHLANNREPIVGPCEHCHEPSDFIKGGEFLD